MVDDNNGRFPLIFLWIAFNAAYASAGGEIAAILSVPVVSSC